MPSRKSAKKDIQPILVRLNFNPGDAHGPTIGLTLSIDPRRLEPGNGSLGGENTFSVHTWLTPPAFAQLLSQLALFGTLVSSEDGDTMIIKIDSEHF